MRTDILTPKSLFQKDIRYTIPPFQRPYVWTQEGQWESLGRHKERAKDTSKSLKAVTETRSKRKKPP